MPLVNQTISAVSLSGGMVSITIGSDTFQYPMDHLRAIATGRHIGTEMVVTQILMNLVAANVDLTNLAAVRTAMIGMVVKVGG